MDVSLGFPEMPILSAARLNPQIGSIQQIQLMLSTDMQRQA